ncbi:MAG TPA: ATP-dependent DNA ligase, partial [Nitriliruptoraceae bacterium]|nr:ATP-dependent DNA ligase [Nitriliruptoraceae bacterium]
MTLPVTMPVKPMLAKLTRSMPSGPMLYEPKWDGFRCVVFRDGDDVTLQSRNGKPLERYFPELLDPLRATLPDRCVVDGELVVPMDGGIAFDAISQRIHPADSRVQMLAEETPARFIAFDVLAIDDRDLTDESMQARRAELEDLCDWSAPIHLTPATTDAETATDWFDRFEGAGLDGVIAKPLGGTYEPGKRSLLKIKHERTCDAVVAGFRWHKASTPEDPQVGSLLLGLFDDHDNLRHIGVASSFSEKRRRELATEVTALGRDDLDDHPWGAWAATEDSPRGGNRWNATKDMSFEYVEPRVAEIAYEQLDGDRLRHSGRFKHWRVDRDPDSATYDQVEVA